jgi:hypothetical protein
MVEAEALDNQQQQVSDMERWFTDPENCDPEIQKMFEENFEIFQQELKWFLRPEEVFDIVKRSVDRIYEQGKHTKRLSRKYLQKINGMVVHEHRRPRRTCVHIKIHAPHRKRIYYDFSVMNYFKTPKGTVYVFRRGIGTPEIHFFTSHLFDRMNQRGATDEYGRLNAIWKVMDRLEEDGAASLFMGRYNKATLAMEDGICLGHINISPYREEYKFKLPEAPTWATPPTMPAFFYMTFVAKGMLSKKQLEMIDHMTNPDKYEGPDGRPVGVVNRNGKIVIKDRGQTSGGTETAGPGHTGEPCVHRPDSKG